MNRPAGVATSHAPSGNRDSSPAESRTWFEVGAEGPLRGNRPLTGYAYVLLTRPHFLEEHVYLRAFIAPVYATGEVIRDHWPTTHSALSLGLGGGLFAASHVEFRDGHAWNVDIVDYH